MTTAKENPRVRIQTCEVWAGYRLVGGRPHGSKWKPQWEVVFTFDSEEAAKEWEHRPFYGDS